MCFRKTPLVFDTLSQGNAIVRDARCLSRLAPDVQTEVFEFVNNDRLPANVASLIPMAGSDSASQRMVLNELVRAHGEEHMTPTAAQNLMYMIKRNALDTEESRLQGSLAGFDVRRHSGIGLPGTGCNLQKGLRQAFTNDKRLFGAVARGDTRLSSVGNVLDEAANEGELEAAKTSLGIFRHPGQ